MQIDISPSDYKTKDGFWDSVWQKSETETIARNIVIVCKELGDFVPFTWEDYKRMCKHKVTESELRYIEILVTDGYLTKRPGTMADDDYCVTMAFLGAIDKYRKEPLCLSCLS